MRALRLLVILLSCAAALPAAWGRRRATESGARAAEKGGSRQRASAKRRAAVKRLSAKQRAASKRAAEKKRAQKKRRKKHHRKKRGRAGHAAVAPVEAPVDVAAPAPGGRTHLPVAWQWPPSEAMRADGERCGARLRALGVAWQPGPPQPQIVTPVEIPSREIGGVRIVRLQGDHPPLVMDCRLAEAMAAVGAPLLRAAGVRELRYSSIFATRNVRRDGRMQPGLSRHALGLALDVHVFVTEDGVAHAVKEDYGRGPLLPEIERRFDESNAFRDVLTPAKDPLSHDDHFHFEARALGDPGPDPPAVVEPASAPGRPDAGAPR